MALQLVPYALISATASVLLIFLAITIWKRRPAPGIESFVSMLAGIAFWSLLYAAELTVTTLGPKDVITVLEYIGITLVPAAWLLFAASYTGHEKWLTRRNITLLAIEPVLTVLATATNNLHHAFWLERILDTTSGYAQATAVHGPLFWIHAAYSYLLLLAGTILLVRALIKSPQVYQGQVIWLLIGTCVPWVANGLYIFGVSPLPDYVDLTPLAFTVTGFSIGFSLINYGLLDIVPVARDIVVDGLDHVVLVFDRGNRIVDANRTALALIGQPADQVIGKTATQALAGLSTLVEKVQDVEQTKTDIAIKTSGEEREYELTLSPLRNRRGDILGRVLAMHDVTALKQANRETTLARQKAEEANRLKTQFLATMSHELRTPLNAINGFTEILLEGMTGELNKMQRHNLERVRANAQDLRQLIDDLLDLARIEAGRMDVLHKPFTVREWLDQLAAQMQGLATEKGLEFEAVIAPEMPVVIEGDSSRLKQIAVNLLSNAFKFTQEGKVRIEIRPHDRDRWAIEVSDTGIGIPPHAQETIFETFYQVDGGSSRKHGGSGLGLSIVRNLALTLAGSVRLKSTLGKGSVFTVLLPLHKTPPEAETQPAAVAGQTL